MIPTRKGLLVLSSGAMVLSGFSACAGFLLACFSQKPLAVSEAAVVLFTAALATGLHLGRGWRRISVAGLHLLGGSFATLRLGHRYYGIEAGFWRLDWVPEFWLLDRGAVGWLVLVGGVFSAALLWFWGVRLMTRPTDPVTIDRRFDAGLGCVLVVLIVKLLAAAKGAAIAPGHSLATLLMAYVVLGLLSMALARLGRSPEVGGLAYVKGAGFALSFAAVALMLGVGLAVLFLPELEILAATGSDLIRTAAAPLGPVVVALIRFVLVKGCRGNFDDYMPAGGSAPPVAAHPTNPGLADFGAAHFVLALMAVVALVASGFVLFGLLRWLRARTASEAGPWRIRDLLAALIRAIRQWVSLVRDAVVNGSDASRAADRLYRRLLRWGRASGLRHGAGETPGEYGMRLGRRFPGIEPEICLIVRVHDEVVYGCMPPSRRQLSRARRALRKIRHPLWWPARIRSLWGSG